MGNTEYYDEKSELINLEKSISQEHNITRRQLDNDGAEKFVNWFERIIQLVRKYTIFEILGSIMLLFALISMLLFFNAVNNEQVLEKWMTKRNEIHAEGTTIRSDINPKVSKTLYKLMIDNKADRVAVFELHNGKENPTSLPFIYCDMTYEEVNGHLPFVSDEYVNLNVSKYKFLNYLTQHKYFHGNIDELFAIDKKFGIRLMENDIKYCQMALIKTDITIGVLISTYLEEPIDKDLKLREMLFRTQQIAAYLDYTKQKK